MWVNNAQPRSSARGPRCSASARRPARSAQFGQNPQDGAACPRGGAALRQCVARMRLALGTCDLAEVSLLFLTRLRRGGHGPSGAGSPNGANHRAGLSPGDNGSILRRFPHCSISNQCPSRPLVSSSRSPARGGVPSRIDGVFSNHRIPLVTCSRCWILRTECIQTDAPSDRRALPPRLPARPRQLRAVRLLQPF